MWGQAGEDEIRRSHWGLLGGIPASTQQQCGAVTSLLKDAKALGGEEAAGFNGPTLHEDEEALTSPMACRYLAPEARGWVTLCRPWSPSPCSGNPPPTPYGCGWHEPFTAQLC